MYVREADALLVQAFAVGCGKRRFVIVATRIFPAQIVCRNVNDVGPEAGRLPASERKESGDSAGYPGELSAAECVQRLGSIVGPSAHAGQCQTE